MPILTVIQNTLELLKSFMVAYAYKEIIVPQTVDYGYMVIECDLVRTLPQNTGAISTIKDRNQQANDCSCMHRFTG